MSAQVSQVIDTQGFIGLDEYQLAGDDSTLERKRAFLAAYRVHGVVSRATYEARIHRTTVYKWLDADPAFVQAFHDCHEDTYDELEASGFQKALAGDPILTMFYLKAYRPRFRDKVQVDIEAIDDQIRQRLELVASLPKLIPQFTSEETSDLPQFTSESDPEQKD